MLDIIPLKVSPEAQQKPLTFQEGTMYCLHTHSWSDVRVLLLRTVGDILKFFRLSMDVIRNVVDFE
jgi:hypothetical protein